VTLAFQDLSESVLDDASDCGTNSWAINDGAATRRIGNDAQRMPLVMIFSAGVLNNPMRDQSTGDWSAPLLGIPSNCSDSLI
jgi:hypothetical protein